jgi:hypothetical protein
VEDDGGTGGGDKGGNAEDRNDDPATAHDKDVTMAQDVEDVAQDTVQDDREPEV